MTYMYHWVDVIALVAGVLGCGCSVWFGNDSCPLSITERSDSPSEPMAFLICDNPPWKLTATTKAFFGHAVYPKVSVQ